MHAWIRHLEKHCQEKPGSMNVSETTRDRAIFTIERQLEVICALSNGDISNEFDGPVTRFSMSWHFEVRDKVSTEQLTCGMVLCLVTLTDL